MNILLFIPFMTFLFLANAQATEDPHFDFSTNQLYLPYVYIDPTNSVSLTLGLSTSETNRFNLDSYQLINSSLSSESGYADYSATNQVINIPRLLVNEQLYQAQLGLLIEDSQLKFNLLSAQAITDKSLQTAQQWNDENTEIGKILTSTCTLNINGTYRMYRLDMEGIMSMDSADGLNFSEAVPTGIRAENNTAKHFIRNPAVISFSDKEYVLIYEGMDSNDNPKLFRATSTDGINFTDFSGSLSDGAVMIPEGNESNFMSVPDMIIWNQKLYIYYVANYTEIFAAVSHDKGISWQKLGKVNISGISATDKMVDPDVLIMPDNSLRLFFAYTDKRGTFGDKGILMASSHDGLNFSSLGQVISVTGSQIKLDPDVVLLNGESDKYRMYYGFAAERTNEFNLYSALSP